MQDVHYCGYVVLCRDVPTTDRDQEGWKEHLWSSAEKESSLESTWVSKIGNVDWIARKKWMQWSRVVHAEDKRRTLEMVQGKRNSKKGKPLWTLTASTHGCVFDPGRKGSGKGRQAKLKRARSRLYRRHILPFMPYLKALAEIYSVR